MIHDAQMEAASTHKSTTEHVTEPIIVHIDHNIQSETVTIDGVQSTAITIVDDLSYKLV